MSTSAERLLYKLHRSRYKTATGEYAHRMDRSVELLDAIDSSFSEIAKRLMDDDIASWLSAHPVSWADNTGWVEYDATIEKALVSWLDSDHRVNNAISAAEDISNLSGMDYNAATFVLEDTLIQNSLMRLNLPKTLESVRYGHRCLLAETNSPYLTLLSDSTNEVNRYCHSVAVAAIIMKLMRDDKRFISEAPEFIAWVAKQMAIETVLQAALRTGSTNPDTITSFMELHHESPTPLHSGLL